MASILRVWRSIPTWLGSLRGRRRTLRAVHNAVLHLALQTPKGEKEPPIARLIKLLEADDDPEVTELALRLPDAWSYLAERPTAMYALRKLHAAGELFIERNRLLRTPR